MNRLQRLHEAGVSIWLDTLSRELLESGEFERLVRDYAITGATSNPTIFAKAITASDRYDNQLRAAAERGVRDPQQLFFELASRTSAARPTSCDRSTRAPLCAMASSPSSAPRTSPTTARGRSSRRLSCGGGSTARTS
jgi:hypothetical protein